MLLFHLLSEGGGGGFVVAIDVNDLGEQELHQVDESAEETGRYWFQNKTTEYGFKIKR